MASHWGNNVLVCLTLQSVKKNGRWNRTDRDSVAPQQSEEEGERQGRGREGGRAGAQGPPLLPVWRHGSRSKGLPRVPPPQAEDARRSRYFPHRSVGILSTEGDLFQSFCGFGLLTLSSFQVPHPVRTMASSQSIPIPQSSADSLGRTRQASECVSTGEIQVIFLNHFALWCL